MNPTDLDDSKAIGSIMRSGLWRQKQNFNKVVELCEPRSFQLVMACSAVFVPLSEKGT